MRKVTSYKCPECGMSYKTLSGWGDHVRRLHPEIVPKGWSDARFFYYTLTGKSEGSCIQCHQPTEWNEATGKYSRYCNNPKCKQEYCKMAKQRMIDKYGKPHLLDDPDKQREMLKAKKNSGEYKFSTGGKVGYVCSYERDFLMTCDVVLGLKSTDIISPSPHNYVYMYEGKPHIYIPDFYIPDFNLEIEVKDGGDNPNMHHKIQEVDKVKEKLKDQVMISNPSVNYFKVVNKQYDDFYDFILNCKNAIDDDKLKQVQSRITATQQPAIEGISLFDARRDALKQADQFTIEFDAIAGPMLKREIEVAFSRYKNYNKLSHAYSYPYMYFRRTGRFIDPAYKNTENLIVEIPLMVVNTSRPFEYEGDSTFDDEKIIDVLKNFERNITSTIRLRGLYSKYPNVSAPYVQWDGSDWMLKVTLNYSMSPANEGTKSSIYYRVTYNGEGIYNALKNNVSMSTWKNLLSSDCMTWLPKPPSYAGDYRSYFTKQGYDKFMKDTYPTMVKYLDEDSIDFEEVDISQSPVYQDRYQIVIADEAVCDIANESAFISYKDEFFNLDEWRREVGHNILYITGLSGSGKSTLGREMSKTYNAMYIELDRLKGGRWLEDEKFNPNGYQNNVTDVLREILKDEDPNESSKDSTAKAAMRNRRFSKVYEYCLKHPDQLFIVEGWQIILYFDFDFLVDKPLVIKNTSMNTSFKRMTNRERNVYTPDKLTEMKAVYKGNEHDLESLRKFMRSKASKSKALPAVESANQTLYHGSYSKLDVIMPRVSTHGKSWVYATADHDFALCYAGKQWNDFNINQCYFNGQLTMTEIEKGAFKKYFDCPGYIYSFDGDNFKSLNRHEFVSDKPVYVDEDSVEYIPNVLDALKSSGVKLYKYPNLPSFISNRDDYIQKKKVQFSMESAVESANSLDWIIERRMTTNDFKEIPDNSLLHLTRDAYLERLAKNPASMRNLEYYGFYNRKLNELTGILSIASDGKTKCIDLLVVDDIYRNHGIGTFMLNSAVVNHGATWLIVKTSNGPAISIYEKYGFKIVDTYPGKTGMVHRMEYHSAANESVSDDSIMDRVLEFNKRMNKFKYGLAVNGVIDTSRNTSGSDYDKLYHFANPTQFEKQDGGICWDFVTYEADYFKKNIPGIKFTCWYVIFNAAPNYPTHTFLTFKLGSKYILFESSFRKIKGVWEASSEKDLINFELDSMIHHGSDKGLDKAESHVFKYNALDTSLNGMTCGEFMHHIEEVGRYVTHTRSTSYDVEKYTPEEAANESVNKSKIDEDFESKGHKSLSSFKCTKLTHELRKKYEVDHKMLKDACENDETHDARIWLDGDKMVAHVCVFTARKDDPNRDGYNWISSLEVSPEYRGYGLGKQLLDFAVDTMGGTALGVYKDNEIAIKMYKDKGFKILDKKSIHEKYPNYHSNACHLMVLGSPANESVGSDASYYGLPEDKKYPMDDPKHVLLAIKFFNYVDEDKEELLASRINSRIAEFKIHNINVGEKNRFAKYYTPVEEEVVVDWAPNVPYMTVANEGTDPSVQLLDDGFAYAPIKLDRDLYEKYKGTDYYPLYIILMKNISPLGSVIRAYTKEEYSHSAISFDASMDDVYTFGNSVIKKPLGRQKSFGAAHESFRKNSFKFSYSGKTEYSLYVMFFKKDEIDRIKKKVDEIFLHHDEYKYNVEGLISYIFNRPKTDPKKLFCSQFVALVINSGRNGILNKDPSLYSPVGLTTIRGVCHVETGHIEDYDQYRVEKKTHALFDSLIENKAYEALEHANIMYNA